MSPNDRKSALLTSSQRDFLRGKDDMKNRSKRAARSRIRERVADGLHDFPLLAKMLGSEEINIDSDDITDRIESETLSELLRSQIAFAYQLSQGANLDFYEILSDGIIQAQAGHIEVLKGRFERADPSLTGGEIEYLRRKGEITRKQRREYFDQTDQHQSPLRIGQTLARIDKNIDESGLDEVRDRIEDVLDEVSESQ